MQLTWLALQGLQVQGLQVQVLLQVPLTGEDGTAAERGAAAEHAAEERGAAEEHDAAEERGAAEEHVVELVLSVLHHWARYCLEHCCIDILEKTHNKQYIKDQITNVCLCVYQPVRKKPQQ